MRMTDGSRISALAAGMVVAMAMGAVSAQASDNRWGWGPAVAETAVNTAYGEGCPIETRDGLSLLIASTRGDGATLDIWSADRATVDAPWSEPERLAEPVTSMSNDFCPLPVGRVLYFVSERESPDVCGGGDIYVTRQSPSGNWSEPQNLGCAPDGPNTPGPERSPSLVETSHGRYLFYSTNGGSGDHDIYVSPGTEDGFGPGRVVRALSSEYDDFMPNVRRDRYGRLEVVFNSNRPTWGPRHRPAFGGQDVYGSVTRGTPRGGWRLPSNAGANVNTAGNETRATLSGDGRRLHFGRDGDIYVSERPR